MAVQPYLFFPGTCEQAIEFYRKALGANVQMMMRAKESPDPAMRPSGPEGEKIMHATLDLRGSSVMCSDSMGPEQSRFGGFSLSLDAKDEAEAKRLFDALAEGGQVVMPLGKTFWTSAFGMVNDRFGVSWMVSTAH